ncbi:hypothetical protein D3C84_862360 [compost metagenome]
MLRSSGDIPLNAHLIQFFFDAVNDIFNVLLTLGTFLLHEIDDPIVLLRIQITEGNILHLPFDRGNTKTMRNRTENLQRFFRNAALAFFRLVLQGPHIVQAIRQLN